MYRYNTIQKVCVAEVVLVSNDATATLVHALVISRLDTDGRPTSLIINY